MLHTVVKRQPGPTESHESLNWHRSSDCDLMSRRTDARLIALWLLAFFAPGLFQVFPIVFPLRNSASDPWIFLISTVAGASIGLGAVALLFGRARSFDQVQLGYLTALALPIVILSFARGLLVPGAFVQSSDGFDLAGLWSVPLAFVAGLPVLLPRSRARDALDERWVKWVKWVLAFATAVALLLINPIWLPTFDGLEVLTRAIVAITWLGGGLYAAGHLTLARRARSTMPLMVALGFGNLSASSLYQLTDRGLDSAAWVSLLLTMSGVFLITLGPMVAYRSTARTQPYIEHINRVDRRSSLEIGMEPILFRYVRFLDRSGEHKGAHVLRTTKLAMTIGQRLNLRSSDLRNLGLAAVLHDVGEFHLLDTSASSVPSQIVEQHPAVGAELVSLSRVLAPIAPIIAAHHERIDGLGYPLAVYGPDIPLPARILAACDAFDALTRGDYSTERTREAALAVLEQNAGLRWDRRVIVTLARHIRAIPTEPSVETTDLWGEVGCDCLPDVQAELRVEA